MPIKLSIVVPVYNCESTIKRTIDSLLPQLTDETELIFVDDGSKDTSLDILNTIKSNNIKVISKENDGLISAREVGIKNSKGTFICNVDGGDGLDIDCLKNIIKAIDNNQDIDYFVMDCKTNDSNGEHLLTYDKDYINNVKYLLLGQCPFSICFKVVRKDLLINSDVYTKCKGISNGEDLCFSFDIMVKTNNGLKLDNCYYIYNIDSNSMTDEVGTSLSFLKALDYVSEEIKEHNYPLKREFEYLVFKKTIMSIILNNEHDKYNTLYNYYLKTNIKYNNPYIKLQILCVLLAKIKVGLYAR